MTRRGRFLLQLAALLFLALMVVPPVLAVVLIVWNVVPREAGQAVGVLGGIALVVAAAIGGRSL